MEYFNWLSQNFYSSIFYAISNLVVWQNQSKSNIIILKKGENCQFSPQLGWMRWWIFLTSAEKASLTYPNTLLGHSCLGQIFTCTPLGCVHHHLPPLLFLVCRTWQRKWQSPSGPAQHKPSFSLPQGGSLLLPRGSFLFLLGSIPDSRHAPALL